MKSALLWTLFFILSALVFAGGIGFTLGFQKAAEFLSGYVIEKTLSIDNLFVFILIFTYFKIPPKEQKKLLSYGIIGAIILRGLCIAGGVYLIHTFAWMLYVFGSFLAFSGLKMFLAHKSQSHSPEKPTAFLLFLEKHIPVPKSVFALLAIELSDVIFAFDSIPAILAITDDVFIVFTSNIFAILGLRSLYTVSSQLVSKFPFLNYGVALILVFVGLKMLCAHFYNISTAVSLGVIVSIIGLTFLVGLKKHNHLKSKI